MDTPDALPLLGEALPHHAGNDHMHVSSWESAFRNLNQAVELIYLMCELESSVLHVDHAARVFREASQDFRELKHRIQHQLKFESYLQESQADHLSIAWEVPSFKQDYGRNVPAGGSLNLDGGGGSFHGGQRSASPTSAAPAGSWGSSLGRQATTEAEGPEDDAVVGGSARGCGPTSPQRHPRARAVSASAVHDQSPPHRRESVELVVWGAAQQLKQSERASHQQQLPFCSDWQSPDGSSSASATSSSSMLPLPGGAAGCHIGDAAGGERGVARPVGGQGLHQKLLSPHRRRREPEEICRRSEARQLRAEQARQVLEAERKAKLEKAKQEREAVRSCQGEQQQVKAAELQARHARSAHRRRSFLHRIVARAADEVDKVKEVQFIKQLEKEDNRAALDARLERGEARRQEALASRQRRHGREVDGALEDAKRRRRALEAARMEELFEKLQRKEVAAAKFEEERRREMAMREEARLLRQLEKQELLARLAQADAARAAALAAQIERRLRQAADRRMRSREEPRDKTAAASGSGEGSGPAERDACVAGAPARADGPADAAGAASCSAAAPKPPRPQPAVRDTWVHRVLQSRGVPPGCPPVEAARRYRSFMKSLRKKACKLRKRLHCEQSVVPCPELEPAPPDASAFRQCQMLCEQLRKSLKDVDECAAAATLRGVNACLLNSTGGWGPDPQELLAPSAFAEPPLSARSARPACWKVLHAARSSGLLWATAAVAETAMLDGWPQATCVLALSTWVLLMQDPCNTCYCLAQPFSLALLDIVWSELDSVLGGACGGGSGGVCAPADWPGPPQAASVDTPPSDARPTARAAGAAQRCPMADTAATSPTASCTPGARSESPATDPEGNPGGPFSSRWPAGLPACKADTSLHGMSVAAGGMADTGGGTIVLDGCLTVASALLSAPGHERLPRLHARRLDLCAYALALGLVYRFAHLMSLIDAQRWLAGRTLPPLVLHAVWLMQVVTDLAPQGPAPLPTHIRNRIQALTSTLMTVLRETSLAGLTSLLTSFLLHRAPHEDPHHCCERPADLPRNFLHLAHAVLRVLGNLCLLDMRRAQALLAAPDVSAELVRLLPFLLTHCTLLMASGEDIEQDKVVGVLNETVLLIGFLVNSNREQQEKLLWGSAPTLLQRLCMLPPAYFPASASAPVASCVCARHAALTATAKGKLDVHGGGGTRVPCALQPQRPGHDASAAGGGEAFPAAEGGCCSPVQRADSREAGWACRAENQALLGCMSDGALATDAADVMPAERREEGQHGAASAGGAARDGEEGSAGGRRGGSAPRLPGSEAADNNGPAAEGDWRGACEGGGRLQHASGAAARGGACSGRDVPSSLRGRRREQLAHVVVPTLVAACDGVARSCQGVQASVGLHRLVQYLDAYDPNGAGTQVQWSAELAGLGSRFHPTRRVAANRWAGVRAWLGGQLESS